MTTGRTTKRDGKEIQGSIRVNTERKIQDGIFNETKSKSAHVLKSQPAVRILHLFDIDICIATK
jgi:hypothetical protein